MDNRNDCLPGIVEVEPVVSVGVSTVGGVVSGARAAGVVGHGVQVVQDPPAAAGLARVVREVQLAQGEVHHRRELAAVPLLAEPLQV